VEEAYRKIVESLGDAREALRETPRRAAEAWRELTSGYQQDPVALAQGALQECDNRAMVLVRGLQVYSLCEHHLLPFFGTCHVAYLPQGKIIGLSRIPMLVQLFARRLQLQERLTQQIAELLQKVTGARGVAVRMEMRHLCMEMRGGQRAGELVTQASTGLFETDASVMAQFAELCRG
jgi:GTP cyclohydrolase IA